MGPIEVRIRMLATLGAASSLLGVLGGCYAAHEVTVEHRPSFDAGPIVEPLDAHLADVCVALDELCNGLDDDCDGTADEGADGTCPRSDASVARCELGMCRATPCGPGRLDCNRDPADACETESDSDRANCGACGLVCELREACVDGACVEDAIVDLAPAVSEHSCMALRSGRLLCWGRNSGGAFADEPMDALVRAPRQVEGLAPIAEVEVGYWATCVRDRAGAVLCAGMGPAGSRSGGDATWFAPVALDRPAVALFGAWAQMCALLDDGVLWCWGVDYLGPPSGGRPRRVDLPGAPTSVYGASNGVCALVDGRPWCWGHDVDGLFASSPPTHTASPVPGDTLAPMLEVRCGIYHCCGVDVLGAIECWGRNERGQLARGDAAEGYWPPAIASGSISPVTVVAAGGDSEPRGGASCALTAAGVVYCWGSGSSGQNGIGGADSHVPVALPIEEAVTSLRAGVAVVCATLGPTALRCWGRNGEGQVGDGSLDTRFAPTAVAHFE